MKHFFIISFLILSAQVNYAATLNWNEGSVVLSTKEVLIGKIQVQMPYDVVFVKVGEQLFVLPAQKLQSIHYYDSAANINRKFTVIQQKINSFTIHRLYEVVVYGDIKVVRRINSTNADESNDRDGYTYYLFAQTELISFRKFRTRLFPLVLRSSVSITDYIEEEKLDPNTSADIIRIISFYNKQIGKETIARNL